MLWGSEFKTWVGTVVIGAEARLTTATTSGRDFVTARDGILGVTTGTEIGIEGIGTLGATTAGAFTTTGLIIEATVAKTSLLFSALTAGRGVFWIVHSLNAASFKSTKTFCAIANLATASLADALEEWIGAVLKVVTDDPTGTRSSAPK